MSNSAEKPDSDGEDFFGGAYFVEDGDGDDDDHEGEMDRHHAGKVRFSEGEGQRHKKPDTLAADDATDARLGAKLTSSVSMACPTCSSSLNVTLRNGQGAVSPCGGGTREVVRASGTGGMAAFACGRDDRFESDDETGGRSGRRASRRRRSHSRGRASHRDGSSSSPSEASQQHNEPKKGSRGYESSLKIVAKLVEMDSGHLKKAASIDTLKASGRLTKALHTYVKNSLGLKCKVHVNEWYSYTPKSTPRNPKGQDDFKMLLWYFAPFDAIGPILESGLKIRPGRLLVFYDRLYPVLEKWHKFPIKHGVALLCEVSLGKMCKSPHGIGHWSKHKKVPAGGFGSVKGVGEFIPDWDDNKNYGDDDEIIIPAGKTTKNKRFRKYELKFSEYIIFDDSKVQLKFIVDLALSK